jgi:hypothetical protein
MNRKFIVPFDTAKILKEAGCDCVVSHYYRPNGDLELAIGAVSNSKTSMAIAAPAYCELIEWFEWHNIVFDLEVTFSSALPGLSYYCYIKTFDKWSMKNITETKFHPTPEDALNEAVLKAMELLNDNVTVAEL